MPKVFRASVLYLSLASVCAYASTHTGLMVEGVESKAGSQKEIQEGDVIYGWRRNDDDQSKKARDLDSPFDFWDLHAYEMPEGKTKLSVRRGEREIEVEVQSEQKIDVSPVFEGRQLDLYETGRSKFASQDYSSGIDAFRELATCLFNEEERERGAWVLAEVGRKQAQSNKWDEVEATFNDASSQLGEDTLVKAKVMEAAGKLYEEHDKYQEASAYFTQALDLRRKASPDDYQAITGNYEHLGRLAFLPGDFNRAYTYFQDSLDLRDRYQSDSVALSKLLNTMGKVALESGNFGEAELLFKRAYDTALKVDPNGRVFNDALQSLGLLASKYGQRAHARQYLSQSSQELNADPLKLAARHQALAQTALDEGNQSEALSQFKCAAQLLDQRAGSSLKRAEVLLSMGTLAANQDSSEGESYLNQALAITARSAPDKPLHAQVLYALGNLQRDQGNINGAVNHYEAARILIENRDTNPDGKFERDAFATAKQRLFYRDHISALIKLGRNDAAFEVSENFRARTLLDSLSRRNSKGELKPRNGRRNVSPQPLNAAQAIALTDPNSCLISYMVLDDSLHIFMLTAHGIRVTSRKSKDLAQQISDFRRYMMSPDSPTAREKMNGLSQKLARLLLAPLSDELNRYSHLVIVPDGPLHVLPFAALQNPSRAKSFLVQTHSITMADSATVYHLLHRDREFTPKGLRWLGFGPPDAEPPRPAQRFQAALADYEHYLETQSMRGTNRTTLPYGSLEVEEVANFFEASSRVLRGPQATESLVRDLGTNAEILHFACHGSFDANDPGSSALILAPTLGMSASNSDGRLTAREIANLNLRAALVVLSACESGLGKDQGGEGSTSLARSFRFAGARSVMASLWRVSDLSTTLLMKSFYRHLLQDNASSEALRLAQIDLIGSQGKTNDVSHPYYWAAFQLLGTDIEEAATDLARIRPKTKTKKAS